MSVSLTPQQDNLIDQLCKQLQWLHDHEKEEIANHVGCADLSYNGYVLCRFVVVNDLVTELTDYAKRYWARVHLRQNPPIDKIREIMGEALQFKGADVDTFAMDTDQKAYAKMCNGNRTHEVRSGYIRRQEGGLGEGEKLDLLLKIIPPNEMHNKASQSPHWRKAWLKAIDIVCGHAPVTLFGNPSEGVNIDHDLLIQQRHEAVKSAGVIAGLRHTAQKEAEAESMKQYAADQEKLAQEEAHRQANRNASYEEALKAQRVREEPQDNSSPSYMSYTPREPTPRNEEYRNSREREYDQALMWGNNSAKPYEETYRRRET